MLRPRGSPREGFKRPSASLFQAARNNDLDLMREAFKQGKTLLETDPRNGFTPLHVAALNGCEAFIHEALKHATAEPWIRDKAGYLAIDHADARGDRAISALFFSAMFPGGRAPLEPQ